jgi:hypothetical protein
MTKRGSEHSSSSKYNFAKAYLELQRMREAVEREEQWAQASPDCSVAAVREDARSMAKSSKGQWTEENDLLDLRPRSDCRETAGGLFVSGDERPVRVTGTHCGRALATRGGRPDLACRPLRSPSDRWDCRIVHCLCPPCSEEGPRCG